MNELGNVSRELINPDYYNLRIQSKKLKSGKCQVKFYATVRNQKDLYGYVLVDAEQTLKNVVSNIQEKLKAIHHSRDFQHIHLYSIGKTNQDPMNFIIFDS